MSKQEHTPTPWGVTPSAGHEIHGQHIVWDESGKTVAVVYTNASDAELLACAVNAHASLIAALDNLVNHHVEMLNSGDCGKWDMGANAQVKEARAALKLARGE